MLESKIAQERTFELERELKTHPGNIGVQREGVQPFTEAELTKFDAMQRGNSIYYIDANRNTHWTDWNYRDDCCWIFNQSSISKCDSC